MRCRLTWIAFLPVALLSWSPCPAAEVLLEYRGRLGEVREYRLGLEVRGERGRDGESRPVRVRAQLELREEVIGVERDGVFWMRVSGRVVEVRDPTGTLASGRYNQWPEMKVRVGPQGRLLGASLGSSRPTPGPPERGFASLMSQLPTVIVPSGPVSAGASWEVREQDERQKNLLLSVAERGATVALVASSGHTPLSLRESSEALGVTTELTGARKRESELELWVERGLVLRHKGELSLTTKEEVTLDLPEGGRRFLLESDLQVVFDLQLLRVDGAPVGFD